MAEAGGGGADTLENATELIEALADWIHKHLGKQGGHSAVFETLAGTKLQGYGMDADVDEGKITVRGEGYSFDVTEDGETITIDNCAIRIDPYQGGNAASVRATLSLRVLLADALQMHRGPSWTVVVKLADVALVTARGAAPGQAGVAIWPAIRWSTLSYLLYRKSYYTLRSGGAFQISHPEAEEVILEACKTVRDRFSRDQLALIERFYKAPTKVDWDLLRATLKDPLVALKDPLVALNGVVSDVYYGCRKLTYDYTAGRDIHTYFSRSAEGAWSHLPTQPLLF
jgi:hypothetical protein